MVAPPRHNQIAQSDRHGSRHSSRPWAGRSTDIRIERSAVYTLRCLFMARITSRDNKRFVSHGFCHCARPSLRFSGTSRFEPYIDIARCQLQNILCEYPLTSRPRPGPRAVRVVGTPFIMIPSTLPMILLEPEPRENRKGSET